MKTQHTPGPWFTEAKFEPYRPVPAVYSSKGQQIAVCREANCVCFTENDVANARLIAAAPELLKALNDLSEIVDWLIQSGNINSPIEPHPYGCGVILARQQARSAIARARGK